MGIKYANFIYDIDDIILDYDRNLKITRAFYIPKIRHKNNKPYTLNEKYYNYHCLKCNNEDTISEYSLHSEHKGCNVCCNPPKKIMKGINDISTTAPWMMNFIVDDEYCFTNAKYSKVATLMKCPHCGRTYIKSALNLCANKGLSCVCKDGLSYPNKYMYALLEQLQIDFKSEVIFEWSDNKRYDFSFCIDGKTFIIEMQGIQHYSKSINDKSRTLEEEIANDLYKKELAISNGVDCYYQINASKSNSDYIKESIISSGILDFINIRNIEIDWNLCDQIATSNFYKIISEFHESHMLLSMKEVALYFKVSSMTVNRAIKAGLKFGWCSKTFSDTKIERETNGLVDHKQKPIYCVTTDNYYKSSSAVCSEMSSLTGESYNSRALRKSIERDNNYKGNKYIFISREEFNAAKSKSLGKCHGDFFNIKENKHD